MLVCMEHFKEPFRLHRFDFYYILWRRHAHFEGHKLQLMLRAHKQILFPLKLTCRVFHIPQTFFNMAGNQVTQIPGPRNYTQYGYPHSYYGPEVVHSSFPKHSPANYRILALILNLNICFICIIPHKVRGCILIKQFLILEKNCLPTV